MAWDDIAHAGFSTSKPWLPLHPDWPTRNVAAQGADPGSMLALYRALLALRRSEPALALGAMTLVDAPASVLAYARIGDGRRLSVLLNLTSDTIIIFWRGKPLLSTLAGQPEPGKLRPNEGIILA